MAPGAGCGHQWGHSGGGTKQPPWAVGHCGPKNCGSSMGVKNPGMGWEWDGPAGGTEGRARVVPGPCQGRARARADLPGTEGRWRGAFSFPAAAAFPASRLRALQCSSHGSAAVCESHQYFMELLPPGEGLLSAPAFCCFYQQGTSDFLPPAPSRSSSSSPLVNNPALKSLSFHPWWNFPVLLGSPAPPNPPTSPNAHPAVGCANSLPGSAIPCPATSIPAGSRAQQESGVSSFVCRKKKKVAFLTAKAAQLSPSFFRDQQKTWEELWEPERCQEGAEPAANTPG